jgi:tripartite-type tricarboxylate transporter receptor subunit TctC
MSDTNTKAEALTEAVDALLTEHGYAAVLAAIENDAAMADGIPDPNRRRLVAALKTARVTAEHAQVEMTRNG